MKWCSSLIWLSQNNCRFSEINTIYPHLSHHILNYTTLFHNGTHYPLLLKRYISKIPNLLKILYKVKRATYIGIEEVQFGIMQNCFLDFVVDRPTHKFLKKEETKS